MGPEEAAFVSSQPEPDPIDQPAEMTCLIKDEEGWPIALINQVFCKVLGYTEAEARGRPSLAMFRPHQTDTSEDQELYAAYAQAKANPGEPVVFTSWMPAQRQTTTVRIRGTVEYSRPLGGWLVTAVPLDKSAATTAPRQPNASFGTTWNRLLAELVADSSRRRQSAEGTIARSTELLVRSEANETSARNWIQRSFSNDVALPPRSRKTKWSKNWDDFKAQLVLVFDQIDDPKKHKIHTDEPLAVDVETVGRLWPLDDSRGVTDNVVRAALRYHHEHHGLELWQENGVWQWAKALKRLYEQHQAGLFDIAAVFVLCACAHRVLGLHHMAQIVVS